MLTKRSGVLLCDLYFPPKTALSSQLTLPFFFSPSDDDIVFEDFARQRLKGMKDDKEEEDEGTNSPSTNDR